MPNFEIKIEEGQRQLILLALATLALRSPGFDFALNEIAKKIDNTSETNRAIMYDQFRELNSDRTISNDFVISINLDLAKAMKP